MFHDLFVY
jgi:hypothetical protein